MDNHEDYLEALSAYARNPTREIPPILERYLNGVAKNGETLFQWPLLKPLIVGKTEQVVAELRQGLNSENIQPRPNVENVRFDVMHARIMDAIQKFNGAPFTIQRLCELLIDPKRHYKRSDKFMRGLEKNVLVVSTVDPFGRKVVSESGNKHLVNGMDTNGSPFFPRDSNISSNLPPVPGWVTSTVAMATPPSNTPATDSSQPKRTQTTQDSSLTSNGVTGSLASSVYADHGEQPLAVHAEEVVEETVVTMDTTEVGAVATDGGESMAEEEEEEEEMGGEDTNASTSSSSSSSSEELSTSNESSGTGSQPIVGLSGESTGTQNRPWASIANEGENTRVTDSPKSESYSSKSPKSSDKNGSSVEPQTDSSQLSTDDVSDSLPQSSDSDSISQQSKNMNDSLGFDVISSPGKESTAHSTQGQQPLDSRMEESEQTDRSEAESSGQEPENVHTHSADDSKPTSSDTHASQNYPSSEHIRSYAEVVSSPSSVNTGTVPPCETEACDSVAGLERLVDSVEPSSMSATFSSLSHFSPNQSLQHSGSLSPQSSSSQDEDDEPRAKRARLSEKSGSSESISDSAQPAVTSQPEITSSTSLPLPPSSEVTPSTYSTTKSDTVADTTSDIPMTSVSDTETPQSDTVTSEPDEPLDTNESMDSVSHGEEDPESTPAIEHDGGGDCAQEDQETSSPPSHAASSNDSQGFDVCGDALRKTSTEEKQASSESVGELTPSDKTETLVAECDTPEEMEQE